MAHSFIIDDLPLEASEEGRAEQEGGHAHRREDDERRRRCRIMSQKHPPERPDHPIGRVEHEYRLELRSGSTHVETEETFSGLLARLMRGNLQKTLDESLEQGLEHLKAESERRATPTLA